MRQATELAIDLCDLSIASLSAGALEAAQRAVAEMIELDELDPQAMTYPQHILWAAAQAWRAAGDERRAADHLTRAYPALHELAAAIPDADSCASFCELPLNRQIAAALERGKWPGNE